MEKILEFNLDVVLEKKKISMSDAMRVCDLSYPTIYNVAKNRNGQVTLKTLQKLCVGLDIKPSELFRIVEK